MYFIFHWWQWSGGEEEEGEGRERGGIHAQVCGWSAVFRIGISRFAWVVQEVCIGLGGVCMEFAWLCTGCSSAFHSGAFNLSLR